MLKQSLWIIFAIVVVPIVEYWLGLQILQLGAMVQSGTLDYDITFNFGLYFIAEAFRQWFWTVTLLVILSILYILWINIIRLNFDKNSLKDKDGNSIKEEDIRHQASTREAKRGTLRIDFDKNGQVNLNSWRFKVDLMFDPYKKIYNKIAKKVFNASDQKLLNTIKYYPNISGVDGEMTRFKSGIPVVFSKKAVWVDAEDNHSLIIGTTNSGKTYSYVSPMIELARICKESIVINDVKGELYKKHAGTLKNDGYKILKVDYIEPKKSDQNNPFGTIIKRYRQAYYDNQTEIQEKYMSEATELFNVLRELEFTKKQIDTIENSIEEAEEKEVTEAALGRLEKLNFISAQLRKRKRELNDIIPKPNYSDAAELVADIANTLCYEKESNDPYWFNSAMQLLEGYIYFLLEERVMTEKGYTDFLPIELVNMYSVKMLHQQGQETVRVDGMGTTTLLEYYLKHYRKSTDNSVKSMSGFISAGEKTRGSIASMLETKIRYFLLNTDVLNMTAESSFALEDLVKEPTALFISVHDEKSTFHQLTTILISQIYEELIKESRKYPKNLRLPIPINIIWDEFANGASWPNIDNALTAGRSRGIRFHLFIQGLGQLENLYGPNKTKTIIDNCVNYVYILGGDDTSINKTSNMCGQRIVYSGKSRQTVPVFSAEKLRMLSLGESIIIRQRRNPYLTKSKGVQGFCFRKWFEEHKAEPRGINENIKQAKYFDLTESIINKEEEMLLVKSCKTKQHVPNLLVQGERLISTKELANNYEVVGNKMDGIYVSKVTGEMIKRVAGGTYVNLPLSENKIAPIDVEEENNE